MEAANDLVSDGNSLFYEGTTPYGATRSTEPTAARASTVVRLVGSKPDQCNRVEAVTAQHVWISYRGCSTHFLTSYSCKQDNQRSSGMKPVSRQFSDRRQWPYRSQNAVVLYAGRSHYNNEKTSGTYLVTNRECLRLLICYNLKGRGLLLYAMSMPTTTCCRQTR